jgi:VRR-NUC domain
VRYAEHDEQVALFRLAAYRKYGDGTLREYIYAVGNAGTVGGRRALIAGVRRKAEGVTAGVPDVECMVAAQGYHGLHIEMKRKDGKPSDVTDAQKKMIARLIKCGRKCVVAYGCDDAWKELTSYLGIKP